MLAAVSVHTTATVANSNATMVDAGGSSGLELEGTLGEDTRNLALLVMPRSFLTDGL